MSNSDPSPGPADSHLQLHLKLDNLHEGPNGTDVAHDSSGHQRHGDGKNRFPEPTADERFGSCLKFRFGTEASMISIKNCDLEGSEGVTLAVWVKMMPPADESWASILKWNYLEICQSNNTCEVKAFGESFSFGVIADDNWHHIAVVVDRRTHLISFYLDQKQVNSKPVKIEDSVATGGPLILVPIVLL